MRKSLQKSELLLLFLVVTILVSAAAYSAFTTSELVFIEEDYNYPSEVKDNHPEVTEIVDRLPEKGWIVKREKKILETNSENYGDMAEVNGMNKISEKNLSQTEVEKYRLSVKYIDGSFETKNFTSNQELDQTISDLDKRQVIKVGLVSEFNPEPQMNNIESYSNIDQVRSQYGYEGEGYTAFVTDGGATGGVIPKIPDSDQNPRLNTTAEKVTPISAEMSPSTHATNVASVIAATYQNVKGEWSKNRTGVAPKANIVSASWYDSNIDSDKEFKNTLYGEHNKAGKLGAVVSEMAWAQPPDDSYWWDGTQKTWGMYSYPSVVYDKIVGNYSQEVKHPMLIVKSAGNYRGDLERNYNHTPSDSTSKNIVTVGGTSGTDSIASFSSAGPTEDGRIKPDVVAHGDNVKFPPIGGTYNQGMSGTSFSAPTVAGVVILAYEAFEDMHNRKPNTETLKAAIIHTAVDKGTEGPDYDFGWGFTDGKKTVDYVRSTRDKKKIITDTYSSSETITKKVNINSNNPFRATLYWNDVPPETGYTGKMIRNNLNMVLISPNGTTHYPWSLNGSSPSDPATRNSLNDVDNVNVVDIDSPETGEWTVKINSTAMTTTSQDFALLLDDYNNSRTVNAEFDESLDGGKINAGDIEFNFSSGDAKNGYIQINGKEFKMSESNDFFSFGSEDFNHKLLENQNTVQMSAYDSFGNKNSSNSINFNVTNSPELVYSEKDLIHGSVNYSLNNVETRYASDLKAEWNGTNYTDKIEFGEYGSYNIKFWLSNDNGVQETAETVNITNSSPELDVISSNGYRFDKNGMQNYNFNKPTNFSFGLKPSDTSYMECEPKTPLNYDLLDYKNTGSEFELYLNGTHGSDSATVVCENGANKEIFHVGATGDYKKPGLFKDDTYKYDGPIRKDKYSSNDVSFRLAIEDKDSYLDNATLYYKNGSIVDSFDIPPNEGTYDYRYSNDISLNVPDGEHKDLVLTGYDRVGNAVSKKFNISVKTYKPKIELDPDLPENRSSYYSKDGIDVEVLTDREMVNFSSTNGSLQSDVSMQNFTYRDNFSFGENVLEFEMDDAYNLSDVQKHSFTVNYKPEIHSVDFGENYLALSKGFDFNMNFSEENYKTGEVSLQGPVSESKSISPNNTVKRYREISDTVNMTDEGVYDYNISIEDQYGNIEYDTGEVKFAKEVSYRRNMLDSQGSYVSVDWSLRSTYGNRIYDSNSNVISKDILRGKWDAKFKYENMTINYDNLTINSSEKDMTFYNKKPENKSIDNASIEAFFGTEINEEFETAEVRYKDTNRSNMYKCSDFDYSNEECNTDWQNVSFDYNDSSGEAVLNTESFSVFAYTGEEMNSSDDNTSGEEQIIVGGSTGGSSSDPSEEEDSDNDQVKDQSLLSRIIDAIRTFISRALHLF